MASLKLDVLVVPVYNLYTIAVIDNSIYEESVVYTNPTLSITIPGFDPIDLPFAINTTNVFNSQDLGLSLEGEELQKLADGVYELKYAVTNVELVTFVEKSIIRIEKLQEKFDNAFMQLDMMQCDGKLKKQAKVELMSIYFFIQGAVAAANSCDTIGANTLYKKADQLLDYFVNNDCGCSGNNYLINYF